MGVSRLRRSRDPVARDAGGPHLFNLALNLAQSRYNLELGSIVELSQAQLQQTQAQIANAQAGTDYQLALAVLQYQTTGF